MYEYNDLIWFFIDYEYNLRYIRDFTVAILLNINRISSKINIDHLFALLFMLLKFKCAKRVKFSGHFVSIIDPNSQFQRCLDNALNNRSKPRAQIIVFQAFDSASSVL